MDNQTILIVGVVVLGLVILAVVWAASKAARKRRARNLQEKFGSEYEAAQERYGPRADTVLSERIKRVQRLNLRPLTREQCVRYEGAWSGAQAHFLDDPALAVAEADRLIKDMLLARGYPLEDAESRAADLSVDHPRVAQDYRLAHSIARRCKAGQATTEEMRESMIHFRSVFQDLLQVAAPEMQEARS